MRALFIGGPWDGRLVEHQLKSATMHVPEQNTASIGFNQSVSTLQPFREVIYVRVSLLGYDFMVEQSIYERGKHSHHPDFHVGGWAHCRSRA